MYFEKDTIRATNDDKTPKKDRMSNISEQIETLRATVTESMSVFQQQTDEAGESSTEGKAGQVRSKSDQECKRMAEDSWYSGILSALDSLSTIPSSDEQPPSQQQSEGDTEVPSSDDYNYIAWLRGANDRLGDLYTDIKSANWGPLTSTSSTTDAVGPTTDDGQSSSYVSSLKQHILAQIESLQLQISNRIDGARAAWGDAMYEMLPEQLQLPWVTACAQMCLDSEVHPCLLQPATVRMGHGICGQEADFQQQRARHMRNDFAEFIGVSAASVDERDIPIIGVAGSGGGFRAMVSTIGYYRAMHISGFARCITYDAAVSGSSWAVAALHTYANGSPFKALDNVREAMRYSMFSTTNLMDFVKSNDAIAKRVFAEMAAKYLLLFSDKPVLPTMSSDSGVRQTASASDSQTTRLWPTDVHAAIQKMLQQGESIAADWLPEYYKRQTPLETDTPAPSTVNELVEAAKSAIDTIPMPQLSIVDLYGALLFKQLIVQHIPGLDDSEKAELSLVPKWTRLSAQRDAVDEGRLPMPIYTAVRHFIGSTDNDTQATAIHEYQWFEFSPYEFGSIDHGTWIPAWAFGRPMIDGQDKMRVGEAHFGSIMGTVASAFCASVKAMVMEVYMNIPTTLRPVVDPLLDWFEHDTEISHIVPPYTLNNPFFRTPEKRSIENKLLLELESEQLLSLMDAGLENNLPFAPLLRKERNVDVVVCLDSSANIDIMPWFARAEAWAAKHQVERWPWGARPWASDPLRPSTAEVEIHRNMLRSTRQASKNAEGRLKDGNVKCVVFDRPLAPSPLRSDSPHSSLVLEPPISILYLPLLGNKGFRDPAFDPGIADFCATFNDKWEPEQVDLLADLASFNFMQETERIRLAVKQAYERKRAYRLYREGLEKQEPR
ncbi:hypothetical protein IW138_004324 [Coemansia sp. RSA 986]|nr:hypothetical protein IW138_004324 [Coemansia sp. RSA 986]